MILAVAALVAPLIARASADPLTLHAVTMEGVVSGWPDPPETGRAVFVSACGIEGVYFVPAHDGPAPWPPYVAPLRDSGMTRCRKCQKATGSRRPRCKVTREAHR